MKLTKTLAITLLTGSMVIGTIGCSSTQPTTINFNSDEPKIEQYEEDHNTNTKDNTPVKTTTPQKSQKTPAAPKTTTKPSNKQQKSNQSSNTQPSNKQQDPEIENPGCNAPRCPLCGDYVIEDDSTFLGKPAHGNCIIKYAQEHNIPTNAPTPAPSEENNNTTTVEPNNAATEGGEINE